MWMWVVHKLNQSIEECKAGDSDKYGSIDEAAAVWIGNPSVTDEGGFLYELAEQLGPYFSQKDGDYMATLNREIISRLNLAQATFFVDSTRCKTDGNSVKMLRKLVKEIIAYMTAVIIQGFIHSMLGKCPVVYLFDQPMLLIAPLTVSFVSSEYTQKRMARWTKELSSNYTSFHSYPILHVVAMTT